MSEQTQKTTWRREYLRRWEKIRYARTKGFDDHLAALVALKLIDRGLDPDEVRECLYLAACEGVFGIMRTKNQEVNR